MIVKKKTDRNTRLIILKYEIGTFFSNNKHLLFMAFALFCCTLVMIPIRYTKEGECTTLSSGAVSGPEGANMIVRCKLNERIISVTLPRGTPFVKDKKMLIIMQKRVLPGYTYEFKKYIDK